MNAAVETPLLMAQRLEDQIATAAARVAPSWPLDRFIAVNPYWGWVGHPMPQAAAALGTLAGTRLTMPREWFRAQWEAGRLQRRHLCAAAAQEVTASVGRWQTRNNAYEKLKETVDPGNHHIHVVRKGTGTSTRAAPQQVNDTRRRTLVLRLLLNVAFLGPEARDHADQDALQLWSGIL